MLISLAAAIVCLGGLYALALAGFRLGDRPEDTRVTAVLRDAWQPDATRPVIAVTVRNPSGTAVLAGMSVRAGLPFRYRLPPAWSGLPTRRRRWPERARLPFRHWLPLARLQRARSASVPVTVLTPASPPTPATTSTSMSASTSARASTSMIASSPTHASTSMSASVPTHPSARRSASAGTTVSAPASVSVPMGVSVPRRTARRRFRAALFDTVGVVPAGADVKFSVPVPEDARGYVLTAVVGQRDRRLRVHRIALAQASPRADAMRLVPPADTPASGGHGR
ncbi:MAG TPA: hypothetical protein VF060_23915 [Trebonia sp.]